MQTTLLITTFNRDPLLEQGLISIAKQKSGAEILVLNDGQNVFTEQISKEYGASHIHTGLTKKNLDDWRVPGFAFNIGARMAQGDILILSCAEMYHVKNCIVKLVDAVLENPQALAIPSGYDAKSSYVFGVDDYKKLPSLGTILPFLMAMRKKNYMSIGGYDEDFTGISYDDNDFVDRMIQFGCKHVKVEADCIHLYHPRVSSDHTYRPQEVYNKNLYLQRKGIVERNINKDWGVFNF